MSQTADSLTCQLPGGYEVHPISWEEYTDACARLEDRIFGDYFAFAWRQERGLETQKLTERFERQEGALLKVILGFFFQDELIGWHYSVQNGADQLVMKDTGILPEHQNKGLYSSMLPRLLRHFQTLGVEKVLSYHRATNNQVIIPKLRAGFFINGLTVDGYGLATELIYAFDEAYRDCLRVRSGEIRPKQPLTSRMGLREEHFHG